MDESQLTITIQNKKPLGLLDLTLSLSSLADQYMRFLQKEGIPFERSQNLLYVKELRSGSAIIELIPAIAYCAPLFREFNTIIQFTQSISKFYNAFLGKEEKPYELDKKQLTNLHDTITPIANDYGSQIIFVAQEGATQNIHFQMGSTEANAVQNNIKNSLANLDSHHNSLYKKVLLRWHQARFESNTKTGDKAIIESISDFPLRTSFMDDNTKYKMMNNHPCFNKPWQELIYMVDVEVAYIDKIPKVYKILDFYPDETFDINED